MRIINIDFNKNPIADSLILGVRGEHKNTKLNIVPPELFDADYYRLKFNLFYTKPFYKKELKDGIIEFLLPSIMTNSEEAEITIIGYKEDGTLVAKSPKISGFIFLPSDETDILSNFEAGVVENIEARLKTLEEEISGGEDGAAGNDGKDGFSPIIEVSENEEATGYDVKIITEDRKEDNPIAFTLYHGKDGNPGPVGSDGFSPIIEVSENEDNTGYDIKIVTENRPESNPIIFTINHGQVGPAGNNGNNGVSPIIEVSENNDSTGYDIKIITESRPESDPITFTINHGKTGPAGSDGTTYIPYVSAEGVLSWTNDGSKENPASVDIVTAVIAVLPLADEMEF